MRVENRKKYDFLLRRNSLCYSDERKNSVTLYFAIFSASNSISNVCFEFI